MLRQLSVESFQELMKEDEELAAAGAIDMDAFNVMLGQSIEYCHEGGGS